MRAWPIHLNAAVRMHAFLRTKFYRANPETGRWTDGPKVPEKAPDGSQVAVFSAGAVGSGRRKR